MEEIHLSPKLKLAGDRSRGQAEGSLVNSFYTEI